MQATFKDIVMYTFIGAAIVLIISKAQNFATAVTAIGNVWVNETSVLSGSGTVK